MRRFFFVLILIIVPMGVVWLFYLGSRVFNETPAAAPPPPVGAMEDGAMPALPINSGLRPADPEEVKQYHEELNEVLSPDRTQSVSLEKETDGLNYLKITDKKTGKIKKVGRLNLEDVVLIWGKPDDVFIVEKPSALLPASAWAFNLKNKTLRSLVKNERGLTLIWSPQGQSSLKFSEGRLFLIKDDGQTIALPFITLPNKCAFLNENKFYCALPRDIPPRTILPDDYLKHRMVSRDEILAVSLEPAETKTIFSEAVPFDAFNLKIINGQLFFINRRDQRVYKIII